MRRLLEAQGARVRSHHVYRKALESRSLVQRLSLIELKVLRRIMAGEALTTIAIRLNLGEGEARTHRESMMIKLGAKDTADAVRIGVYAGVDDQC